MSTIDYNESVLGMICQLGIPWKSMSSDPDNPMIVYLVVNNYQPFTRYIKGKSIDGDEFKLDKSCHEWTNGKYSIRLDRSDNELDNIIIVTVH